MRWYHWVLLVVLALVLVYVALDRYEAWRKSRDSFVRNERLNRFNVSAFRGTRKFDDPRWPS